VEIVKANGLHPIVSGAEFAARELDDLVNRTEREITQLEELATQCSRALRNLSVNRKFSTSILSLLLIVFYFITFAS
jgi:glutamine synthetase